MRLPTYKQQNDIECGPACLKIIAEYYQIGVSIDDIKKICATNDKGSAISDLTNAASILGFETICIKITYEILIFEVPMPVIVHWRVNHYVVVLNATSEAILISDPSTGLVMSLKKLDFLEFWLQENKSEGVVILFSLN